MSCNLVNTKLVNVFNEVYTKMTSSSETQMVLKPRYRALLSSDFVFGVYFAYVPYFCVCVNLAHCVFVLFCVGLVS